MSQLQTRNLGMIGAYDLNPDRQSLVAKARRHCECRTTRHGDGKHAFHPFVVGFHFLASKLLRPMGADVEWKELGCGNNEEVILFEKSSHGVIHSVRTTDAAVISKAVSFKPLSTSNTASGFNSARFAGSL